MTDNLNTCANCGHIEYHHRPECTHVERKGFEGDTGYAIEISVRCDCLAFVEQTGESN